MSSMPKEKLQKIIERYVYEITMAKSVFVTLKSTHDLYQEYPEEMELSTGFFQAARKSLEYDFIMTTARLFDNNRDTYSIFKLLRICENSKWFKTALIIGCRQYDDDGNDNKLIKETIPQDIPKYIKEATGKLENEFAEVIKNLKAWRDKLLAHNDNSYFLNPSKLGEDHPLFDNDVKGLLDFAQRICNELCLNLGGNQSTMEMTNSEDLKNLLDVVRVTMKKL